MRDRQAIEAAIRKLLGRKGGDPVTQKELVHRLHVSPDRREAVRRVIARMLDDGALEQQSRGRLAIAEDRNVEGRLELRDDGSGRVIPDGGGAAVYLDGEKLDGMVSGDRLRVRRRRRGRSGRVVAVVEERKRTTCGVVERRDGALWVRSFEKRMPDIRIEPRKGRGAREGQVVALRFLGGPADAAPRGQVTEVIGTLDDPGIDVEVVTRLYELPRKTPPDVLAAARKLPARIGPKMKQGRRRFDDPPCVTIDGETAQDFDDAIAVKRLRRDLYRLWVHIADVAAFVPAGSMLDRDARDRGTSVYFPGRVLPMFPEKLSNDLCSLRPGVDRLVQTVVMDIDSKGRIRKARFDDGVIRSAARLTYSQVAGLLDEGEIDEIPDAVVPMLEVANELRRVLERRRIARGATDFDLPRPTILLDVEGAMTGIQIEPRNRAHRMIESFMLAANEAVAEHLDARGLPCMFRNHEPPDPTKLEGLEEVARGIGVRWKADHDREDRGLAELIAAAEARGAQSWAVMLILRAMQQARYAMENRGHFGLGAEAYCHFTSPIRRYPDLVTHRLLREARGVADSGHGEDRLGEVAEHCSRRERVAERAEREVLAWKKVAYIADHVGERFKGSVTGTASFGAFVQLDESHVEGLLSAEQLGEAGFEYDGGSERWVARSGREAIRHGSSVEVRLDRVDRILRRVDLGWAGNERKADAPSRGRGRRRRRRAR